MINLKVNGMDSISANLTLEILFSIYHLFICQAQHIILSQEPRSMIQKNIISQQKKITNPGGLSSGDQLPSVAELLNDASADVINTHEEYHVRSGQYLKSAVYGGTDGVINCLAVIIGGIASNSFPSQIMAFALSVVIGDGVGMGLGDYLSAKAEKQFIQSQEKREIWEIQNQLEAEKCEIAFIFNEKGYTLEQSKRLADLFATNPKAFTNLMMLFELGLVVDDTNPKINGLVNSLSYVFFGTIPLIPYFITVGQKDNTTQHLWTIALAGVELFILGFLKALLIGMPMAKRFISSLQFIVLGTIAIATGYGIGKIFENM